MQSFIIVVLSMFVRCFCIESRSRAYFTLLTAKFCGMLENNLSHQKILMNNHSELSGQLDFEEHLDYFSIFVQPYPAVGVNNLERNSAM